MLQIPDGHGRLELTQFQAPSAVGGERQAPANALGIRHITFAVDDIEAIVARLRARGGELIGELGHYRDNYRLCYLRGPQGITAELAESIN
jgi:catechol 2,3-dioxygenase-like lactoylglutathione lyase family enzyme